LLFCEKITFDLVKFANKNIPNYQVIKDKTEDPKKISASLHRNKHYYIGCESPKDKYTYILLILATFNNQVVIFCFNARQAEELEQQLLTDNRYKIGKLV
jgi:superfamily II DNA/RNA helicase